MATIKLTRRDILRSATTIGAMGLIPASLHATANTELATALTESNLVYLSPLKTNGALSSCQAEVWYVMMGADMYVVTATDSWRATAPTKGLTKTKVWVGDRGVWKRADYQSLPATMANADLVADVTLQQKVLEVFGDKYSAEWGTWGPRFSNGLADGSRAMLRYQLS